MKSANHIQTEVERTLDSLDGLKRAETAPFFYTRLMARLERSETSVWNQWMELLSKPAVSLGLLLIFLCMNGYLLFNRLTEKTESQVPGSEYVAQQITYFDNNTP